MQKARWWIGIGLLVAALLEPRLGAGQPVAATDTPTPIPTPFSCFSTVMAGQCALLPCPQGESCVVISNSTFGICQGGNNDQGPCSDDQGCLPDGTCVGVGFDFCGCAPNTPTETPATETPTPTPTTTPPEIPTSIPTPFSCFSTVMAGQCALLPCPEGEACVMLSNSTLGICNGGSNDQFPCSSDQDCQPDGTCAAVGFDLCGCATNTPTNTPTETPTPTPTNTPPPKPPIIMSGANPGSTQVGGMSSPDCSLPDATCSGGGNDGQSCGCNADCPGGSCSKPDVIHIFDCGPEAPAVCHDGNDPEIGHCQKCKNGTFNCALFMDTPLQPGQILYAEDTCFDPIRTGPNVVVRQAPVVPALSLTSIIVLAGILAVVGFLGMRRRHANT